MLNADHQPRPDDGLDLTRAEAWMVHHVMTDRMRRAEEAQEPKPWWTIQLTAKLEGDDPTFSTFEAWRLQVILKRSLQDGSTPARDRELARMVLDRIDERFEAPPALLAAGDDRVSPTR